MKIYVKSYANFRSILGKELDVDLGEGSTVEDLLKKLISSHQTLKTAIFDDTGVVREHIILMKNRKDIDRFEGLRTELNEGDEVAILPPVSGG